MSKGSKRGNSSTTANSVALTSVTPVLTETQSLLRAMEAQRLFEAEDLRRFDPDPGRMPRRLDGLPANVNKRYAPQAPGRVRPRPIGFTPVIPVFKRAPKLLTPHRVAICLRRAARREVLHALKLTGGRGGGRRHHWNANSRIKC